MISPPFKFRRVDDDGGNGSALKQIQECRQEHKHCLHVLSKAQRTLNTIEAQRTLNTITGVSSQTPQEAKEQVLQIIASLHDLIEICEALLSKTTHAIIQLEQHQAGVIRLEGTKTFVVYDDYELLRKHGEDSFIKFYRSERSLGMSRNQLIQIQHTVEAAKEQLLYARQVLDYIQNRLNYNQSVINSMERGAACISPDPGNGQLSVNPMRQPGPSLKISIWHISYMSSPPSHENMIGLVLYGYAGQTSWDINGVHCESGYVFMKRSSELEDIRSDIMDTDPRGTFHARLYKLLFDQEADEHVVGMGFAFQKGEWIFRSYTFNVVDRRGRWGGTFISNYHDEVKEASKSEVQHLLPILLTWQNRNELLEERAGHADTFPVRTNPGSCLLAKGHYLCSADLHAEPIDSFLAMQCLPFESERQEVVEFAGCIWLRHRRTPLCDLCNIKESGLEYLTCLDCNFDICQPCANIARGYFNV